MDDPRAPQQQAAETRRRCSPEKNHCCQHVDLVQCAVADKDERGNVAAQVQERVQCATSRVTASQNREM